MDNKFLLLESALNTILNINIGKEIRLKEFKKVEGYANGLIHLTVEQKKLLSAVLEAFKDELAKDTVSEECIGGYNRILKEILNINNSLKGKKCVVFGDNWLAEEVKSKMRARNYCVFGWRAVNPFYMNKYDLYLVCSEALNVYDLPAIEDKEKIIKIWDFLKYKFVVFPSFYGTYINFKKQNGSKIKCVVTGTTNIKSAVNSKMVHTKTVSLANNAQDIFYDYKMFCHAYESMPEVKYAIIGLAPYSLRYDTSKSKVEFRRCLVYYPIVKTMHNCEDAKQLTELYESEDNKIKQYFDEEYMQSLYDLFAEQEKSEAVGNEVYDEKGRSQECLSLNQREIGELYNKPFTNILQENKAILEEYVSFCREKGIKVIFFIPPFSKWYKLNMNRTYYTELIEVVTKLREKYKAEIVDMMNVPLPDCCFSDYANVNNVGAVKVASYINEIIDH